MKCNLEIFLICIKSSSKGVYSVTFCLFGSKVKPLQLAQSPLYVTFVSGIIVMNLFVFGEGFIYYCWFRLWIVDYFCIKQHVLYMYRSLWAGLYDQRFY